MVPLERRRIRKKIKAQVLHTFRIAFVSWTSGIYFGFRPVPSSFLPEYPRTSDEAITKSAAVAIAMSGLSSFRVQIGRQPIIRTIEAAADVAALCGHQAERSFWQNIEADIAWFQKNPRQNLLRERLWLKNVRENKEFKTNFPLWVRETFDTFEESNVVPEAWKVWLHWYRALLSSKPLSIRHGLMNPDVGEIVAKQGRRFWRRDPDIVMAEIAKMAGLEDSVEEKKASTQTIKQFILTLLEGENRSFSIDEVVEAFSKEKFGLTRPSIRGRLNSLTYEGRIRRVGRAKYASVGFDIPLEIESFPTQGPGPHFRTNEDGVLDRAPPSEFDAVGNDGKLISQLKPLVLRCGAELQATLSRNEFPELLDATERYLAALDPGDDHEIEWGEVWGLGVVLQNAATSAQREINNRILPELEDPAKTALDSLLTMHGPMILGTRDGARLSETASLFSMTREEQQSLRDAAQKVAERLRANPSIITKRASVSVEEAVRAIGNGPHPERGSIYGLATIKNISIVLIGGAAVATPTLIGAFLGDTTIGTVVGAPWALLVVEAIKKNAAFIALATQLGAHLETMTDVEIQSWIERKARRLAPFKTFVSNNKEQLTKIAEATPELRWMLKYIAFITGESNT